MCRGAYRLAKSPGAYSSALCRCLGVWGGGLRLHCAAVTVSIDDYSRIMVHFSDIPVIFVRFRVRSHL